MLKVLSLHETYKLLREKFNFYELKKNKVNILKALNMTAGEDILCNEDIPSFNRSTMDGYALKAKDTFGANESTPSMLNLIGEVKMGNKPDFKIESGQAAYIPTGGMLPEGSDSVVMIEYTEKIDERTVMIEKGTSPGENIVKKGEDISKDTLLFKKGHVFRPQDIGVLASLGINDVVVFEKPKLSVISTGNELIDIDEELTPGKIRDINSYSICTSVLNDGFEFIKFGIAKDSYEDLESSIKRAMEVSDIVLLSGGSSVGILDLTYKVIDSFEDSEIILHGVSVKPGKPTIAARIKDKIIFGLPGHPVSAFMIYRVVVSEFIKKMMGRDRQYKYINATFGCNYSSSAGRDEYLPVELKEKDNKLYAFPVYGKSSMMTTLSEADGYVSIGALKEGLYENEEVKVEMF